MLIEHLFAKSELAFLSSHLIFIALFHSFLILLVGFGVAEEHSRSDLAIETLACLSKGRTFIQSRIRRPPLGLALPSTQPHYCWPWVKQLQAMIDNIPDTSY
jgi:hypothetical protein